MSSVERLSAAAVVATELAVRRMYVELGRDAAGSISIDGVQCRVQFSLDSAEVAAIASVPQVQPVVVNEEMREHQNPANGVFSISGFNAAAMQGTPFRYGTKGVATVLEWIGLAREVSDEGCGGVCGLTRSLPEKALRGATSFGMKSAVKNVIGNTLPGQILGVVAGELTNAVGSELAIGGKREEWKKQHRIFWTELTERIESRLDYRIARFQEELNRDLSYYLRAQLQVELDRLAALKEELKPLLAPPAEADVVAPLNDFLAAMRLHQMTYFNELACLNRIRCRPPETVDEVKGGITRAAAFVKRRFAKGESEQ